MKSTWINARIWQLFATVAGICALQVIPGARADELNDDEKQADFISMFNGQDFTGWRFTEAEEPTQPKNWSIAEGVIKLSGGGSPHLATEREYADFEMRFQWRALRDKYNGGFFIRSGKNLGQNQLNLAHGGEGNVIGGKVVGAKAVPDLQNPAGQWNEWRVLVVGDKVTFWCNDKLAWEGTGLSPVKGYIGLQAEGAALEFRNLRIRDVK
jgi:hypothetical protein